MDPQLKRPPTVSLTVGKITREVFLKSFSLRFTLFLEDGTPSRAIMATAWKEFDPAEEENEGHSRH
jgi:hypothetical protein